MSLESVQSELAAVGQRLSGSFTTVEDRQRTLAKQRSLEIKFWIEQKKAYPRDSGSTKTAMSTFIKDTWKTVKGSKVADIIRKNPWKSGTGAFLTGGATLAFTTRPDYRTTGIIPGGDDAYNTIEGLPHGGMGQDMRKSLTDFGSGWNALRGLTRASETFAEMTASKGFQRALSTAQEGAELGEGMFGKVVEMTSSFRGQQFRFARKTGYIGHYEVEAMKAMEHSVAPNVYASKADQIDMELFKGKTIHQLHGVDERYSSNMLSEEVDTQFEALERMLMGTDPSGSRYVRAATKHTSSEWKHHDLHHGNIMSVVTPSGKRRLGIIDWGHAMPKAVDPFAVQPGFSGFDDAYNTIEGLPHGGLGQDMRRDLTEFGSGWRGMFTSVAGTAAVGAAAYAGLGYATRVPKHELIGMSYLGMSEEDLYAALTKPRHSQWDFTSVFRPHEERESAATVGTAFHEYLETLKMAEGGNVEEIERHVYSRKHGLSGYADVIYDDNTVSDIKSVGRDVFQQIKSRNVPVQKHFDQVNAYAVLNESRKGRIEYHLRNDPSQKMVYEWDANEENFKNTMAKVNRVRQRINVEIAAGTLKESDLQMKKSLEFERVSNIFVRNPFSFDVTGTSEALQGFITKRETFYNDRRNSTFEQLENFNISMMDGNKTEHMFKAAKDGGRRHQRMGYA